MYYRIYMTIHLPPSWCSSIDLNLSERQKPVRHMDTVWDYCRYLRRRKKETKVVISAPDAVALATRNVFPLYLKSCE